MGWKAIRVKKNCRNVALTLTGQTRLRKTNLVSDLAWQSLERWLSGVVLWVNRTAKSVIIDIQFTQELGLWFITPPPPPTTTIKSSKFLGKVTHQYEERNGTCLENYLWPKL